MIGKISGIVDLIDKDTVLVDVGGLGYTVNISLNTKNRLPQVGEKIALYTEMMVREDSIQLIGFSTALEKEWFRLLISVQGVGAKAALAILGVVSLNQLSRSIVLGNPELITSAPGVGPKIAKRIILELAQKALLLNSDTEEQMHEKLTQTDQEIISDGKNDEQINYTSNGENEAISAMVNLGYDKNISTRIVAKVCSENSELEISEIIRLSLQRIVAK